MIAQEEVKPDEAKPEDPKPDEPPPIGTNNVGSGPPDGFGLGAYKGGGGNGIGGTGRRVGGSKFGWYASKVQSSISEAMRKNTSTRKASLSLQVSIWADGTGRVTRAKLAGSSGDPAVDEALRNSVLTGLQLSEPPPADMPMPIVLKLSARKPDQLVSK